MRGFGLESDRPVFIVGMPRSGTSLTEQILASHPRGVFGSGRAAADSARETFSGKPSQEAMEAVTMAHSLDCLKHLDRGEAVAAALFCRSANWKGSER